MKTHIAVAWALGVTGVAMFAIGLILTKSDPALKTMNEPAEYAKVRDNIDRVMVNSRRLIEFEAKWRKRVEEGKP